MITDFQGHDTLMSIFNVLLNDFITDTEHNMAPFFLVTVTPPFTPPQKKMLTLQSPPAEKGRRRSCSNSSHSLAKRSLIIKQGEINSDQELLLVAHDIASCWEDVGTRLGLDYTQLQSLATTHATKSSHLPAYHMLQCWRRQKCEQATYYCLCTALEEAGMNSCARQHCYLQQEPLQS